MKRLAEEDDAVRLVSFDDEAYVRFTVTRGGCFRGVPPLLVGYGGMADEVFSPKNVIVTGGCGLSVQISCITCMTIILMCM